jgi:hypothetical protein
MPKSSRFYIRGNTNLKIVIMKKLKKLKGAKELNKLEQQAIRGGKFACGRYGGVCPPGWCCINNTYCELCMEP